MATKTQEYLQALAGQRALPEDVWTLGAIRKANSCGRTINKEATMGCGGKKKKK